MINTDFVKELMKQRGYSQKALAVDMKVTESCVSRMLSGQRGGSLEALEGLIRAFPDVEIKSFLKMEK